MDEMGCLVKLVVLREARQRGYSGRPHQERLMFVLQSAPDARVESMGKCLHERDFCPLIHFYFSRILRPGVWWKRYWEGKKQMPWVKKGEFLLLSYLRSLIKFYFAAINTKRGSIAKSQATFSRV